jgi:heptosyltransferase-3
MSALAAAAFAAGLLGGVHCAGMCGGIVASLSLSARGPIVARQLAFNAGRIGSYAIAGVVAGAAGSLVALAGPALLAQAALYIGPDTSVTHLAASTGVPVIALFGPTDPTRWGPIGTGAAPQFARIDTSLLQRRGDVVLLQGPGHCVPCGRLPRTRVARNR